MSPDFTTVSFTIVVVVVVVGHAVVVVCERGVKKRTKNVPIGPRLPHRARCCGLRLQLSSCVSCCRDVMSHDS